MKVFSFEKYKNWCTANHQQFFDLLEVCDGKTGIERNELGFTFLSCDEWSIDSSYKDQNRLISSEVDKMWRAVLGAKKDAEQAEIESMATEITAEDHSDCAECSEALIEGFSPTRYHIIITDPSDTTSSLTYRNEGLVASIDTGDSSQIIKNGLKVYIVDGNDDTVRFEAI